MEADWEVEIGGNAPIIDARWEGLVDLRHAPKLAAQLPEARQLPALADALTQLNSGMSPFWTSKCDVWRPEEFDLDELDARPAEASFAIACYIDLLPWTDDRWPSAQDAVAECQALCARLRRAALRCCRADLVLRRACTVPLRSGLGITAYLTACGPALELARGILESALNALVDSILQPNRPAGDGAPQLQ